ncbi:MAG TPA: LPS export ABC transporter permease LptF [Steroidobacteraceae bacterium]|nr:LPS export ABC transporter permease LptF [Steroidobacteraceae bacterium]
MQILQRYFFRELALNFLAVTGALLAILVIYQLGAVLERAAQYQYPRGVVLQLFALGAAENFTLLLPLGLMLGIVLALGRLYHESEMTAAQACGFGGARAWMPVGLLAAVVAGASGWMSLQLAPRAATLRAELTARAVRAGLAEPFTPGRFRSFDGGRTIVYGASTGAAGDLQRVFIKQSAGNAVITTVAQRARREAGADGLSQTIVLLDGERFEGVPGTRRYHLLRFDELRVPLAPPAPTAMPARLDALPTRSLVGSAQRADRAELQWRVGFPLMVVVAALCAAPLGRLRPRQGRYARVWQAVLFFAIYGNLAIAARTWYEHGATPASLGIWWVHVPFLLLAAYLIRRRA